jgi:hypothetical protein
MPGYRFNLTTQHWNSQNCDRTRNYKRLSWWFRLHDYGRGTGGHITGCAEILKQHYPNLKVFAVEPEASPVISGGAPGPHPLQGIGAGFIPTNLYTDLLDGAIQVSKDEAYDFTQSSQRGRNVSWNFFRCFLSGGRKKLSEIPENAKVLTFATILENTIWVFLNNNTFQKYKKPICERKSVFFFFLSPVQQWSPHRFFTKVFTILHAKQSLTWHELWK